MVTRETPGTARMRGRSVQSASARSSRGSKPGAAVRPSVTTVLEAETTGASSGASTPSGSRARAPSSRSLTTWRAR